jgi:hypothetical protein
MSVFSWKECRILVDGSEPSLESKVADFPEAKIETYGADDERFFIFQGNGREFALPARQWFVLGGFAEVFADQSGLRVEDLEFRQDGRVIPLTTRIFDLSVNVPITFSVALVPKFCRFLDDFVGVRKYGAGMSVGRLRQKVNDGEFLCEEILPYKRLHIEEPGVGFFRNEVTVIELPDAITFTLTDNPMLFIHIGDVIIDYEFPEQQTVLEAKAALELDDLVQNGNAVDDAMVLAEVPNEFEVIGVPLRSAAGLRLNVTVNDTYAILVSVPRYAAPSVAKTQICAELKGLAPNDFDLLRDGRPMRAVDPMVPGNYSIAATPPTREFTFKSPSGPQKVRINVLSSIWEIEEIIQRELGLLRVKFYVGGKRLNKYAPFCLYKIDGEISTERPLEPDPQRSERQ